jgi:uncharacterized protein (DUF1330 family)
MPHSPWLLIPWARSRGQRQRAADPSGQIWEEFPSVAAWEAFYNGETYQGLKAIRDECSSARLVSVEGLDA